jgi:hypothetical protein
VVIVVVSSKLRPLTDRCTGDCRSLAEKDADGGICFKEQKYRKEKSENLD